MIGQKTTGPSQVRQRVNKRSSAQGGKPTGRSGFGHRDWLLRRRPRKPTPPRVLWYRECRHGVMCPAAPTYHVSNAFYGYGGEIDIQHLDGVFYTHSDAQRARAGRAIDTVAVLIFDRTTQVKSNYRSLSAHSPWRRRQGGPPPRSSSSSSSTTPCLSPYPFLSQDPAPAL